MEAAVCGGRYKHETDLCRHGARRSFGLRDGAALAPPAGARKLFEFSADGVQIYICEPKDQGLARVFDAPDAVLFDADGKRAGTHAKGPSWTLADGSSIEGEL